MKRNRRIMSVGHRGAGALCPANTRVSFETAIAAGVDLLETDLRRCATGEIVLAHDEDLHGVDGTRLPVHSTALDDLRRLDPGGGEQVLILEELLTLARGRCGVMLDLKGEGFEDRIVQSLRDSGFDPEAVIIPGASRTSRLRLQEIAPEFRLSLSMDSPPPDGITSSFVESIDTPAVTWYYKMLSREVIEMLHHHQKTVFAWTVDREEWMRRLIDDGVDGIITNRPDLLNGVLESS